MEEFINRHGNQLLTLLAVLIFMGIMTPCAIVYKKAFSKSRADAKNDRKKAIILRWEKLRLVYNLILLVEGLWLLRENLVAAAGYWWIYVPFVIFANVGFCLGPLLEICVDAMMGLRINRTRYQSFLAGFRYLLFSVGLLFSMWWVWKWALRGIFYINHADWLIEGK